MTVLIGLLLSVGGLFICLLSLSVTNSVTGRLVMVLAGIAVSLIGIIGFVNRAFMKNAIWRSGR
jgi:hypothetical protein